MVEKKGKIIMTVGIQGSGKSNYSKELIEESVKGDDLSIKLLSSDNIRDEMFGNAPYHEIRDKNHLVFDELYKRTKEFLDKGIHVVIDATNGNSKRRKAFCERFKDYEKLAIFFSEPLEVCKLRNKYRYSKGGHYVPENEIEKTYKNMQVPTYSEGWDRITLFTTRDSNYAWDKYYWEGIIGDSNITGDHDKLFSLLSDLKTFGQIKDFSQDNSYHAFSVSRHTFHVFNYILDNYETDDIYDKLVMMWSALFHDTGKFDTKSFTKYNGEPSRYASFIGHENVSGQHACLQLLRMGYDTEFILKVVEIVNNHMKLLHAKGSEKSIKKLRKKVGEEVFKKLEFFREADTSAK